MYNTYTASPIQKNIVLLKFRYESDIVIRYNIIHILTLQK
jgi:hypothetical protein